MHFSELPVDDSGYVNGVKAIREDERDRVIEWAEYLWDVAALGYEDDSGKECVCRPSLQWFITMLREKPYGYSFTDREGVKRN